MKANMEVVLLHEALNRQVRQEGLRRKITAVDLSTNCYKVGGVWQSAARDRTIEVFALNDEHDPEPTTGAPAVGSEVLCVNRVEVQRVGRDRLSCEEANATSLGAPTVNGGSEYEVTELDIGSPVGTFRVGDVLEVTIKRVVP